MGQLEWTFSFQVLITVPGQTLPRHYCNKDMYSIQTENTVLQYRMENMTEECNVVRTFRINFGLSVKQKYNIENEEWYRPLEKEGNWPAVIYSVITHIQFSTVRAHTMERQPALSVEQCFKTQILKRLLLRQLLLEGETRAEMI